MIILIFLFSVLFFSIIVFIKYGVEHKKTLLKPNKTITDYFRSPQKKALLSKFDNNLVKILSYLGLNQFVIGLTDKKIPKYETIFLGDPELFMLKVFNGKLNTSSTPLIQGIIDFLSLKLKKNIKLFINDKLELGNIIESYSKNDVLNLKIKNDKDHFFINSFEDTKGDGYCFFHSIIYLIEKEIPDWQNIVFLDIDNQQILTEEQIQKKMFDYKSKYSV
ncbi:hypothetical protein [Columbia Basin potato purple top phytoplasma]|uniref:Effector n=1 Tax=Columbia Basin potato purple top phytoplasma TaxID=307134 RepID=A0ABT5LAP5_9MOLU|nr:hypothetical protein [Columbia Basin potato purple top phytoplasma]MDC9032176.1 hypothetical protein [Columbia Basin potato purple top phytoplasma]